MNTGLTHSVSIIVKPSDCASAVGSGGLDVYSTPSMIGLMETAAYQAVQKELSEGDSTVGVQMNVSHLKASKIGEKIEATAVLTEIDGRMLTFSVEAKDSKGNIIGKGTHQRCIISIDRFLSKL